MLSLIKEKNELTDALHEMRSSFYSVGAFSAVINVLALVPSFYMMQVYDRVLNSRNETTLLMLTLLALGLFVLAAALEAVRTFVLVRVGARMDCKLNQRVYTAAYEAQLRRGGGNASQALRDMTHIRQFMTGPGVLTFFDVPWIPIYLFVLFVFDFWVGVLAVAGAGISILLTLANDKYTRRQIDEASALAVRSGATADSNLRNAEVIEAMGMLGNLKGRWLNDHMRFLGLQAQASDMASIWMQASKYFRVFLQSAVLGLGALLVLENHISSGIMIAGSILMGKALAPIDQLIGVWKSWATTVQSYQRLRDLLTSVPARPASMPLPEPQARLTTESLTVVPPGSNRATVQGVNLRIEPGTIVAIIGPSGAGKSSLARALVGVWPAAAGKVRIDGADIAQWDRDRLGPFIGYLPQDVELFAGTVAENIARFGELDAERIVAAAKAAGIHDMVLQLPKGYDTALGEQGAGLSGGQKQRLGLARALYGNPRIIVLDEPNSSLDDAGEAALVQAIQGQKALGHIVILVTHKTSIVNMTDALAVMQDGRVLTGGPTQEVLARLSGKPLAVQTSATAANQVVPAVRVNDNG